MSTEARTVSLPLLDSIKIASACPARWDDMTGDETSRHCAQCDLDVYNISSMTREEAESFLLARFTANGQARNGRVCAGFYRRPDGTILTRDCPVGLAAVRRRARLIAARIAASLGLTALLGLITHSSSVSHVRSTDPFPRLIDAVWMITGKTRVPNARVPPPPGLTLGLIDFEDDQPPPTQTPGFGGGGQ